MIAKHIAMGNCERSSVVRLIEYITSTKGREYRVGEVFCGNCRYDDPAIISREMLLTQLQNTRSESAQTYHLLLSFRPGEDPDSDAIHAAVKIMCQKLGFGEHQYLTAGHHDTDNVHVHIAINKVHKP